MKKVFLLLVLALLLVPTISALAGYTIINWQGNDSEISYTIVETIQTTVNPVIGADIRFVTVINVSSKGAGTNFNFSGFDFYLPDNRTTETLTDFTFTNATGAQSSGGVQNASAFTKTIRNYVTFELGQSYSTSGNDTNNGTTFNISWKLNAPIAVVSLGSRLVGRAYTETFNITNLATNVSIFNASLVVTPSFWHTRIGGPSIPTFNGTEKGYSASLTNIAVYTNLNQSKSLYQTDDMGSTNMIPFGSGWNTLSVTYNGPTIDDSSGKSSTVTEGVIPEETKRIIAFWWLIGIGALFIIGGTALLAYFLKKQR